MTNRNMRGNQRPEMLRGRTMHRHTRGNDQQKYEMRNEGKPDK